MRAHVGRGWWSSGGIAEPHFCFQERLSSHPSIKHSPLFPPPHPAWSIHPPLLFSSLLLLFPLAIPAGESAYRVTLVNGKRQSHKRVRGKERWDYIISIKGKKKTTGTSGVCVGRGWGSSWCGWILRLKKKTRDDDGWWEKFKVRITASMAELKLW